MEKTTLASRASLDILSLSALGLKTCVSSLFELGKVMKILVDLHHPSDINFFKNAILLLAKRHECDIGLTVQPRGRLVSIVQRELPDFPFSVIGTYRKSLAGKMCEAAYLCLRLLTHVPRGGFDVVASFGGVGICHATYVLRKPSVIFTDDIEYKLAFYPYKPFATRIVVPQQVPLRGKKVVKYRGFKELAHLHPNYFKPDEGALREYGLIPEAYVFVREVSGISMNYAHLENGRLAGVCKHLTNMGVNVVLSLEDKSLAGRFAPHCTILEEPVKDIHSLMYFASLTISSGDTMARESCLTGTPAIYTGGRYMSINTDLIGKGIFFESDGGRSVVSLAEQIIKQNMKEKTRRIVRQALSNEWEDTTEVIVSNILSIMDRDQSLADCQ